MLVQKIQLKTILIKQRSTLSITSGIHFNHFPFLKVLDQSPKGDWDTIAYILISRFS